MKVLHLNLKKCWFDLIAAGVKKEEYRDLKAYWVKRFIDIYYPEDGNGDIKTIPENIVYDILVNGYEWKPTLKSYFSKLKDFDTIVFRHGYAKECPEMVVELKGIDVSGGVQEWGAKSGEQYIVLKLGKILSIKNYNKQ